MPVSNDASQVTKPYDVAVQALQVGAFAGGSGLIYGGIHGTVKARHPGVTALASGIQYFCLGTTFWLARSSILQRDGLTNWWHLTRGAPLRQRHDLEPTPKDRVHASTAAGGISGALVASLLRGPRHIIPAAVVFTLVGYGGQSAYNYMDERNTKDVRHKLEHPEEQKSLLVRVAESRFSPFTIMSDQEYEDMLNEKLLKLETEIALIDDRIEEFRKEAKVGSTEDHGSKK